MDKLLIYGAYGYTGRLIVTECLKQGIQPVIAGRNEVKIKKFAHEHRLKYSAFEIEEKAKLIEWLQKGDVVIHCGGPFIHTAKEMIEACLETRTHYVDITGEYQVFDLAQTYDEQARDRGMMILPGAGFDVVPSDCLANHLKEAMPDAQELKIAFVSSKGRLSRGTLKTMIENLGEPLVIRKNGNYDFTLMGNSSMIVDFGKFSQLVMGITWGDVSTGFYSTGIPTIEVFSGTTEEQLAKVKKLVKFSFLLKSRFVKSVLKSKLDKKPDGPSPENRETSKMYLWGSIRNKSETIERRMTTPNGYTLTALTSVLIAQKILRGNFKVGYQTPSTAYGKNLILEVEGCRFY